MDAISDGRHPDPGDHGAHRAGRGALRDSFAVYPGINLTEENVEQLVDYSHRIATGLDVRGLVNIQYVIFQGQVYVLEVNPAPAARCPSCPR